MRSHKDTERHSFNYWKDQSVEERFKAAAYLNSVAYGYSLSSPPRMDKSVFSTRKRQSMSEIYQEEFLEFIEALNNQEVEYIIVGGYAVILHGYPRTTGDLDVWVDKTEANYDRLVNAFAEFKMPLFDMTAENFLQNPKMDVFAFGRSPVSIEILNAVKGLQFENAYQNSISRTMSEVDVRLLSREDLLTAKRAANRPRDLNDIENLSGE